MHPHLESIFQGSLTPYWDIHAIRLPSKDIRASQQTKEVHSCELRLTRKQSDIPIDRLVNNTADINTTRIESINRMSLELN